MPGADLLRRVVITCGYCLEKWNPSAVKSAVTAHRILKEEYDDELGTRKQTIKCCRCGTESEHFPKRKGQTRSQIREMKAKREAAKLRKREAKKSARRDRLNKRS